MASPANLGFVAQEAPPVSDGASYVPFWITGTATSTGSAAEHITLKDANGAAIKMPRDATLEWLDAYMEVSAGSTAVRLAKNGAALTTSGATYSAINTFGATGIAAINTFSSSDITERDWAAGDGLGVTFSGTSVDRVRVTLRFRQK